jgi:hypothetical protein
MAIIFFAINIVRIANPTLETTDLRKDLLCDWLTQHLNSQNFDLIPASEDASFRRYFRASHNGQTWIAMDAPPDKEDCRPFVKVAKMLSDAGLNAPQVIAQDLDRGFLLLSDLGRQTYLDVINAGNAERLFIPAIDALIRWQSSSRPGVLPGYDETLLCREMQLFPDWYIARHLKLELTPAQASMLEDIFARLVKNALGQAQVFVHRDYMPRNLMISDPNPGVLDFQDAVYGPITYDVVSLFRDAFISWDEEFVQHLARKYWEQALAAGLPVRADFTEFYREFEWMGLQRHLKVLGIFARINYRDGKPKYLADTPRFLNYARTVAGRYAKLNPLVRLLDQLEASASKAV